MHGGDAVRSGNSKCSESEDLYQGEGGEQLERVVQLVGWQNPLLDIGCGRGNLARVCENACDGVEPDSGRAEEARRWCRDVFEGSLEDERVKAELGGRRYGAVTFIDSIEHMVDPLGALECARGLVIDGGFVVVAAPNVAHYTRRLGLVFGDWTYTDEGVMDRTHLWFFTLDSLRGLMASAGLTIRKTSVVCSMPRGLRFLETNMERLAPRVFGKHLVVCASA